ncbi:hypothetical protein EVAR_36523_1 [Eumeta japonica]|uniref:Uncharacterized protein n=1 Tax=Eumeta variegata TaxID=151549 RepID=A0A4C1X7H3_EUMVA|nr:hypothetical protein EVAR_36523_1 [Eumeta japonica]
MEEGFTKAKSSNLPRINSLMLMDFVASKKDFYLAEFRNVKTTIPKSSFSAMCWPSTGRGLLPTSISGAVTTSGNDSSTRSLSYIFSLGATIRSWRDGSAGGRRAEGAASAMCVHLAEHKQRAPIIKNVYLKIRPLNAGSRPP